MPIFGNPLSELDVSLADTASFTYTTGNTVDHARLPISKDPHPVIRLSAPPLAEQLPHLASPNPQPVFLLPLMPPQEGARQAASLARNRTLSS